MSQIRVNPTASTAAMISQITPAGRYRPRQDRPFLTRVPDAGPMFATDSRGRGYFIFNGPDGFTREHYAAAVQQLKRAGLALKGIRVFAYRCSYFAVNVDFCQMIPASC